MNKKSPWARTRKGFKHQLIAALVAQDLSFREADRIVDSIFDAMKQALRKHESVKLPFGTLRVVANPPGGKRAWKFGKVVIMHAQPYRVVLDPED